MSDNSSLLKALVIYAVCLPLAIFLGYLMATPEDLSNEGVIGGVLVLLAFPLLMRWHHALLVVCWNMVALAFFLPGRPPVFLPACAMSLLLGILHYILNRRQRIPQVPALVWPMLALTFVVLVTAYFTGGMGIRAVGSATYGGKRYIFVLAAIAGYFALTSQSVSPERAPLYAKLYFLSQGTLIIGHLFSYISPSFYFIFLVFPADFGGWLSMSSDPNGADLERMAGLSIAALAFCLCLLALYGVRGVLDFRRPWRVVLFLVCTGITLFGGFRSNLILLGLVFGLQFCLEGLYRTRLLPILLFMGLILGVGGLPFVRQMPLSVQRTLSFLPIEVDPVASSDAEGSTQWRVDMWYRVLPEVPKHLLLGKGYGIDPAAIDAITLAVQSHLPGVDRFEGSMIAGDYHSGPLSVVLPLGIWGLLAFLWLLYAGGKALYQNYAYGDARLKNINALLFCYLVAKAFSFFFIFGSLFSDLAGFTGILGMSVCLNNGVRVPVRVPVIRQAPARFRFANAT